MLHELLLSPINILSNIISTTTFGSYTIMLIYITLLIISNKNYIRTRFLLWIESEKSHILIQLTVLPIHNHNKHIGSKIKCDYMNIKIL